MKDPVLKSRQISPRELVVLFDPIYSRASTSPASGFTRFTPEKVISKNFQQGNSIEKVFIQIFLQLWRIKSYFERADVGQRGQREGGMVAANVS